MIQDEKSQASLLVQYGMKDMTSDRERLAEIFKIATVVRGRLLARVGCWSGRGDGRQRAWCAGVEEEMAITERGGDVVEEMTGVLTRA